MRDAIGLSELEAVTVKVNADTELLVLDIPMVY
jgi:hypothetical protein